MDQPQPRKVYRLVIGILGLVTLLVLIVVGIVLTNARPPSPEEMAATLTALPTLTPTQTPIPTAIPTVPGVSADLLVCQREAAAAMNARNLVGTVNISDDHLLMMSWVSQDWQVNDLDDALSGIIMGFDVALDVWERGCAVYDRVQIQIYDGPGDRRRYRLSVEAKMDDLLRWRAGEYGDKELIARLVVTFPES